MNAQQELVQLDKYSWKRYGGYEVSSKGDRRFSAFYAKLIDGRSIEEHYQCDVKGYDPGGTNWRLGKGQPSLRHEEQADQFMEYLSLWREWAKSNPELINELSILADKHSGVLSDRFATSFINQACALSIILNDRRAQ